MQKRIPQRSKIWIFSKPWVDHLQIKKRLTNTSKIQNSPTKKKTNDFMLK